MSPLQPVGRGDRKEHREGRDQHSLYLIQKRDHRAFQASKDSLHKVLGRQAAWKARGQEFSAQDHRGRVRAAPERYYRDNYR